LQVLRSSTWPSTATAPLATSALPAPPLSQMPASFQQLVEFDMVAVEIEAEPWHGGRTPETVAPSLAAARAGCKPSNQPPLYNVGNIALRCTSLGASL
jgi:hypothetical protein